MFEQRQVIQRVRAQNSLLNYPHLGTDKARAPAQRCTGHPGHTLNHTVELIQFIWPGSRYGAITSLLTECGGGATPECSENGQSVQLIPLQEGGLLFKDVGAKFD